MSEHHAVFTVFHAREPIIEVSVYFLPPTMADNNSFRAKLHRGLRDRLYLKVACFTAAQTIRQYNLHLFPDGVRDYFPTRQQLDLCHLMTRVKNPSPHDRVNIVKQVIADKVHRHANRAQGSARRAILKHHATDWRILIDVFKWLQSDPLVGWSLCSLLFCYVLFSLTVVWVGLIQTSLNIF